MKASFAFALTALAALVSASPIEKRAGPSGKLISPTDSDRIQASSGIHLQYSRVNGDQGFYTEYIDVQLVDSSSGKVYNVAMGLTSSGKDKNIDTWLNIPTPASNTDSSGKTTKYQVRVTEHQIGKSGAISFLAAAPSFTYLSQQGSACAGAPNGNCGNTY